MKLKIGLYHTFVIMMNAMRLLCLAEIFFWMSFHAHFLKV